uniref:STRA8 bHLH domain-containing protein n=1 Tax=Corvus moneduloides TaxID=1196302 RepID=A0A8C3DT31_CORMO
SGRLNPLPHLQEVEHCMAKQHLPQAHHWVPLARLFSSLRGTVLSQSDNCASKYQVLRKAKTSIQKLEQTLCSLLKMKGNCMQVFAWTKSPDLVFMCLLNRDSCTQLSPLNYGSEPLPRCPPDFSRWLPYSLPLKRCLPFLSFPSRYLYFYKHTVDLLIEHGIVLQLERCLFLRSPQLFPISGKSFLKRAGTASCSTVAREDFFMDPKAVCPEPACTEGVLRDSGGNSEEASGSSVMFEDAFDVAAGFLDRSKTQGMSSQSSAFASCTSENPEDHQRLYLQVTDFLKHLFFANTQFCQVSLAKGFLKEEFAIM